MIDKKKRNNYLKVVRHYMNLDVTCEDSLVMPGFPYLFILFIFKKKLQINQMAMLVPFFAPR